MTSLARRTPLPAAVAAGAGLLLLLLALAAQGRLPTSAPTQSKTGNQALRRRLGDDDGAVDQSTTKSPYVGEDPGDRRLEGGGTVAPGAAATVPAQSTVAADPEGDGGSRLLAARGNATNATGVDPEGNGGSAGTYKDFVVLRATPSQLGHLQLLTDDALGAAGLSADVWSDPRFVGKPVDLMLRRGDVAKVAGYLDAQGITFKTLISDVQAAIDETRPLRQRPLLQESARNAEDAASLSINEYHTYEDITAWVEGVAKANPKIASVVVLGNSYENRTAKGLRISAGARQRPVIFIMCGIHAREWISPASCRYVIDQLIRSQGTNNGNTKWMVQAFEWHIMPMTNVDGYAYTWSTDRLWRKTRRPQEAGCTGADPNRNFDFHRCIEPMSNFCFSQTYCGDRAFSEPCVNNIAKYLQGLKQKGADIQGFVDIHSYSQMWMWPWGWTTNNTVDEAAQSACGHATVDALRAVHGTDFQMGPIAQTIYQVGGSSTDWAYGSLGVKFAYAVELRDQGEYGFLLPPDQIQPSGEELLAGLSAMARCMVSKA